MIERLFSSQLRLNIASGVVTTVINTAVMAVGYPIYLHYLGYEKYGLWLVLSVVLTFAQLGNLGIGSAVTKLVAEEYGRGDVDAIQRYITTALVLLCLSGSAVLITTLLFKGKIIGTFKLSDANAQAVSSLVPYIGMLSIYVFVVQVFDATLSGLGRMDLANYNQAAARIAGIIAAAFLLYKGLGILGLLIGNTLSYLINHVLSFVCIRRIERLRLLQVTNFDKERCKRLLHFGGIVFGGSLVSTLFSPFNKLMLSRYAGVAAIPIYEIAFAASMQVRGLIESGLKPLMPEVSRLNGISTQYARGKIIQIYHRSMKLVLLLGLPIYLMLVIFCPWLLRLWLGDQFVETLPIAFRIMLLGSFISITAVPSYYTLMGIGRVVCTFGAHVVQAAVNVTIVLSVAIMSRPTVNTVAVAASTGMAAVALYLGLYAVRTLKAFGDNPYPISHSP